MFLAKAWLEFRITTNGAMKMEEHTFNMNSRYVGWRIREIFWFYRDFHAHKYNRTPEFRVPVGRGFERSTAPLCMRRIPELALFLKRTASFGTLSAGNNTFSPASMPFFISHQRALTVHICCFTSVSMTNRAWCPWLKKQVRLSIGFAMSSPVFWCCRREEG